MNAESYLAFLTTSRVSSKSSSVSPGKPTIISVEELNKKIPGYVTGRLSKNSVVHFEGCKELIGKIVDVNLKEAKGFYYMGEMVKKNGFTKNDAGCMG